MDSKFLKDALFGGMTGNAIKLGTVLSLGWFWIRTERCYTIYHGLDGVIDHDNVVAVMNDDAEQVSISVAILAGGEENGSFVRRHVSHCGLESGDSPIYTIPDAPNVPIQIEAEPLAGGAVKIRFWYPPVNQIREPDGFNIYIAEGGVDFDYDSPTGVVSYGKVGKREFYYDSDPLVHGTCYKAVVRAYCDAGESLDSAVISFVADAVGPDAITGLAATWEDI